MPLENKGGSAKGGKTDFGLAKLQEQALRLTCLGQKHSAQCT
eukprot:CAMPEP_0206477470 /NCGR_PEP_ID=MMETSP0324_2-20121206/35394_1 /ASSEMBLY_ACC=CAM_ASM_000836 /TAXON_ID=2866 /ORGANISM="Crypthecodinium cohnii, Strain Seligo" /LENGTH=41 /DNA_ID= /DNA_START= /DNA_END= /DNA_ORIENTATION=